MTLAAETRDLTKRFPTNVGYKSLLLRRKAPDAAALSGVNLQVRTGEVFGVLGTNGAGKTTLLKVLASLVLPNEGSAFVHGHDVAQEARETKRFVGYVVTEERSFYWRIGGLENLRFFAVMNNVPRQERDARINEVVERLELGPALDKRVLKRPALLLMDEPTRSLDPVVSAELRRFIQEELVQREGKSVIIATHNLAEARQMCDRVVVLHRGEVARSGDMRDILGGSDSAKRVTVNVEGLREGVAESLERLPGVHGVVANHSVDGNGVAALDIMVDEPKVQVPLVLESIYHAKGRVFMCQPREVSLEEILQGLLNGKS